MICPLCGTPSHNSNTCPKCGENLKSENYWENSPEVFSPEPYSPPKPDEQPETVYEQRVTPESAHTFETYIVRAAISAVVFPFAFFLPVIAIVLSVMAGNAYKSGKLKEAQNYAKTSRIISTSCIALSVLIFTGIIVFILFASRTDTSEKACLANRKMMQAAVEMYNLDHTEPIQKFNDEFYSQYMYNGNKVKCNKGGSYSIHYDSDEKLRVICTVHKNTD